MKRTISWLLVFLMVVTAFTGCTQNPSAFTEFDHSGLGLKNSQTFFKNLEEWVYPYYTVTQKEKTEDGLTVRTLRLTGIDNEDISYQLVVFYDQHGCIPYFELGPSPENCDTDNYEALSYCVYEAMAFSDYMDEENFAQKFHINSCSKYGISNMGHDIDRYQIVFRWDQEETFFRCYSFYWRSED